MNDGHGKEKSSFVLHRQNDSNDDKMMSGGNKILHVDSDSKDRPTATTSISNHHRINNLHGKDDVTGWGDHQHHHHHHNRQGQIIHTALDDDNSSILGLLPTEIQLALLEDTVFGWTHLTSEFVGHTLVPFLVYWVVWSTSYHLLLLAVVVPPSTSTTSWDPSSSSSTTDDDPNSSSSSSSSSHDLTMNIIEIVSHVVAIIASGCTFCLIRNRRRVWFRYAYGTKGYQRNNDIRRREVQQTDKYNVLGRMIYNIQVQRRRKELKRAKSQFAQKHQSTVSSFSSSSSSLSVAPPLYDSISNNNNNNNSGTATTNPSVLGMTFRSRPVPMKRRGLHQSIKRNVTSSNVTPSTNDDLSTSFLGDDDKTTTRYPPNSVVPFSDSVSNGVNNDDGTNNDDPISSRIHHRIVSPATNNNSHPSSPVMSDDNDDNEDDGRHDDDEGRNGTMTTGGRNTGFHTGDRHHRRRHRQGGTTSQYAAITQDHVPIPTIHHLAYAHGGFFGAAPFFLADPKWVKILRQLLPDVYVEISRRVLFSPSSKLIHWAENNPVVAAYGVLQALQQQQQSQHGNGTNSGDTARKTQTTAAAAAGNKFPDLEWDIFVDPRLVRRVQAVLDAMDEYSALPTSVASNGQSSSSSVYSPPKIDPSVEGLRNQQQSSPLRGGNLNSTTNYANNPISPSRDQVVQYLQKELVRRTKELTDQLLIAHGNLMQLMLEQTGLFKDLNYSRVRRTRRTLGGGIYARQWMAIFAEALRLGSSSSGGNSNDDDDQTSMTEPSNSTTTTAFDDDDNDEYNNTDYTCLDTTLAESLAVIRRITNLQHPVGIVLDIKSRHVSPRIWSLIVDTLQIAGIRVVGIGSFDMSEIRGVRYSCQTVTTLQQEPLRSMAGSSTTLGNATPLSSSLALKEILFVHSAGDIQAACEAGKVQPGDHVFFNGGSLIYESTRSSSTGLCSILYAGRPKILPSCGMNTFPSSGSSSTNISFDHRAILDNYRIHPCGLPSTSSSAKTMNTAIDAVPCDVTRSTSTTPLTTDHPGTPMTTLQDYKRHYQFSMGIYVQEFAIDEAAARILVELVNTHPTIYDLGFAWGGINGMTVRGIQPDRFTSTDGYWNQRRIGQLWKER